jgi:6-phosphogluconolactonase
VSYYAYIALQDDDKIALYAMDPRTGKLAWREDVALPGGPAPLAVDPTQQFLYIGLRGSCELASARIDRASGRLTLFGGKVKLASDPCYISTDRRGRYLFSAYYGAGVAAVHPIGADGAVHSPAIEWIKTAANAHCIQPDRSNRYVFVPHIAGPNLIDQFLFDEDTGHLVPNAVPQVIPEAGAGPRHYVYHPTRDIAYFDNEQGSSVTAYHLDTTQGTLTPFQTVSTLPPVDSTGTDFHGQNTCAQIHIDPLGRFMYASNRGHDSIACFAIDRASGALTSLGQQPTVPTPRAWNLDPDGQYLYACSLVTGQLASYRIDQTTGRLHALETFQVGHKPMWVLLLKFGAQVHAGRAAQ